MPETRAGRSEPDKNRVHEKNGITYFLGIGIDEYQAWPRLRNAVRDVRSIADLLTREYGLAPEHTFTLFDAQATRAAIIELLEATAKRVKPTDSLLVYYAGHGHLNDRKRGYWVPADAPQGGISYYISNSTIRDYLGDIPSLHTLLISDACFSGSLFVRGERSAALAADELAKLSSRWAICSGRHDEVVADGPEDGHSPFAESILDVLSKTERPTITTNFLFEQVRDQTRANYDQLPDGGPIQGVGHKRGQFIFRRTKTEAEVWAEAQKKNTAEAFRYYLSLFPNGAHQQEVKVKLQAIAGDQAWRRLKELPTDKLTEVETALKRVRSFCQDHPNHARFGEALALGQQLEQRRSFLQVYDSEFGLMAFVRRDTPLREEAQRRLAELQKGQTTKSIPPQKTTQAQTPTSTPVPPPPKPKTEKKSAAAESRVNTQRPPAEPLSGNKRPWIIGGLAGLIILLLLGWGINQCTGSNDNTNPLKNKAETIEKELYQAMRERDAEQVKQWEQAYRDLPDEVTKDLPLKRAEKWLSTYQDSLISAAAAKNATPGLPTEEEETSTSYRRPTSPEQDSPRPNTTDSSSSDSDQDKVYVIVQEQPRFPGCENQGLSESALNRCASEALFKYIVQKTVYPARARAAGLEGRVFISIVINQKGLVEDAKVVKDIGLGCGEAALKVFLDMQRDGIRWTPGKQNGRPVKTQLNLPVIFRL